MDLALADLEKAEARADRLQARLDEEKALSATLRKQLRESAQQTQRTAQQMRQLVGAPNMPEAPGGSVASLQRTISGLRDRLDIEKKSSSSAHAEKSKLEQRLATGLRERQALLASQQELRAELQRRNLELDRANAALREAGESQGHAMGQVSSLTLTRERERQSLEKEIHELKQQLDLEKKRAANRASRAAAAEAKLRARGGDGGGSSSFVGGSSVASGGDSAVGGGGSAVGGSDGGSLIDASVSGGVSEVGSSAATEADDGAAFDLDFGSGRRAMDFDIGDVHGVGGGRSGGGGVVGVLPSASVSSALSSLEWEKSKRIEAEAALAVATSEHAAEICPLREESERLRQRVDELESQLERRDLEAGGTGARAALRALERQLSDEKAKAKAAAARERAAVGQLRSVLASLRSMAEAASGGAGQELRARETVRELRASGGVDGGGSSSSSPLSLGEGRGGSQQRPHWAEASGYEHAAVGEAEDVAETAMMTTMSISDAASGCGSDTNAAVGGHAAVSPREVERCLQMIEKCLRASDAVAAAGSGGGTDGLTTPMSSSTHRSHLDSGAASSKGGSERTMGSAASSTVVSHRRLRLAEDVGASCTSLSSALSELSGAAAQSPTTKQQKQQQQQQQRSGSKFGSGGGSGRSDGDLSRRSSLLDERRQLSLADRSKAAAAYEAKLARAAAAEERREAREFEERLAVAQLTTNPALDAASRALCGSIPHDWSGEASKPRDPKAVGGYDFAAPGAPAPLGQSGSDDRLWDRAAALVSSPPSSPPPLTREQIKAGLYEKLGGKASGGGASETAADARLCSTTLLSTASASSHGQGMLLTRPSTAGPTRGVPRARGVAGRGTSMMGRGMAPSRGRGGGVAAFR